MFVFLKEGWFRLGLKVPSLAIGVSHLLVSQITCISPNPIQCKRGGIQSLSLRQNPAKNPDLLCLELDLRFSVK